MTGHMGGLSLGAGAMKSQGLIGLAEKSRRDWPDRNYEAFMNLGLPQPKGRGDLLHLCKFSSHLRRATLKMVEEIYSLYTVFWTKRNLSLHCRHHWVWCTCQPQHPWGYSQCKPGDLHRALRKKFGSDAVGSTAIPNLLN
jgi:hypothetical protein